MSNAVTSISITPTSEAPNASITVNGEQAESGSEFGPVSLDVGANNITIVVTAENNPTEKSYSIMTARGDAARWGTAVWGESLCNP